MNIFSQIKNAIFGNKAKNEPKATPPSSGRVSTAPPANPPRTTASAIPASPVNANWEAPVDVEEVLSQLAAKNNQKLNWQSSIVDLMKLLNIDSSLENRKELAQELGYSGDTKDSATMNIWLHKRVMQELEKNGGKVPASLMA